MSVQMRTLLDVADNSGARKLAGHPAPSWQVSVKRPASATSSPQLSRKPLPMAPVKKGKVVKAVIVRTRKEYRRRDGTYIRFDPERRCRHQRCQRAGRHPRLWPRSPASFAIRSSSKIVSLAPEVI